MTVKEARKRAARLGLSAWVVQAVAAGEASENVPLKRVGFASIDFPLAEGETWEEALSRTIRIIFSA
ncbi:MAG TPA: hypothetical protein VID50_01705 [Candidatus Eisenbacteria bacterium]